MAGTGSGDLLSPKEFAARTGLTVRVVRSACKRYLEAVADDDVDAGKPINGLITCATINGYYYISPGELERFIKKIGGQFSMEEAGVT